MSQLRINPPAGRRPSLEYRRCNELSIDPAYQRSIETSRGQKLVNAIARAWDWNLCQPLAVSRRLDGALMVVDGQHRLAAAKLRGDIYDLPCVVTAYDTIGEEAAAFVALNRNRRALSALELFKGSLAAGDREAAEVMRLIEQSGLSLARHSNYTAWAPGNVSNISGIVNAYRKHGAEVTAAALAALAGGFDRQVLRYAGTIFPGVADFIAAAADRRAELDHELLIMVLQGAGQDEWVAEILREQAACGAARNSAAAAVVTRAYDEAFAEMAEAA